MVSADDPIREALDSMNMSEPMRFLFGADVGDAIELLEAQEIERVVEDIEPIIRAREVAAWQRGYHDNPYRTEPKP